MSELNDFVNAIVEQIASSFEGRLSLVAPYRAENLVTPAALVAIESIEQSAQAVADGRLPMEVSLAVHCILSHKTPHLEQALDSFAQQVAVLAHRNWWGLDCVHSEPKQIQIFPGELTPKLHAVDSRIVLWQQTLLLDQPIWDFDTLVEEFHFTNIQDDSEEVVVHV